VHHGRLRTLDELGIAETRVCAFELRDLSRWPLGVEYPRIVADVLGVLYGSALAGRLGHAHDRGRVAPTLVVDAGGVGGGIVDMIRERGLDHLGHTSRWGGPRLVPLCITTGHTAHWDDGRQYVPKGALVSAVDTPLSQRRLWVPKGLALWPVLATELQDFRVKRTASTGYESFAAREGQHDDLVLSLAIGVWWGLKLDREEPGEYVVVRPGSLS